MSEEFPQSLILLFSGALITLAGTLINDALKARRDAERETAHRKEDEASKLRDEGRQYAMSVRDAFIDLGEFGTANRASPLIKTAEIAHLLLVLRRDYLLIPSLEVRNALLGGLWLVVNGESESVSTNDWTQAAQESAFILSAYLRGDELPQQFIKKLEERRARY